MAPKKRSASSSLRAMASAKSTAKDLNKFLLQHQQQQPQTANGIANENFGAEKHLSSGSSSSSANRRPSSERIFHIKISILISLAFVRILAVLIPQYGYIQPDEFHQFTEPIAARFFHIFTIPAWEFNGIRSLRCMLFPILFAAPAFHLAISSSSAVLGSSNITDNDNHNHNHHLLQDPLSLSSTLSTSGLSSSPLDHLSAYALLIGPRIAIALGSFVNDFAIFRITELLYARGPDCRSPISCKAIDCLLAHASSYLAFTYYTHTFGNTIETILFGALLVTILESLRHQAASNSSSSSPTAATAAADNHNHNHQSEELSSSTTLTGSNSTSSSPSSSSSSSSSTHSNDFVIHFRIALLLSFGFFARPTFAIFAFVPMCYWLVCYHLNVATSTSTSTNTIIRSYIRNSFRNAFHLFAPFTISCIFLVTLDTAYHHGLFDLIVALRTLSFRDLPHSVVITPVNFLAYNLRESNLAKHGLHPVWFHAAISVPLMFGPIGVFWYFDLAQKLRTPIVDLFFVAKFRRSTAQSSQLSADFVQNSRNTKLRNRNLPLLPLVQSLINRRPATILTLTALFSLVTLSLRPHHEPRFLLPLIIPLCCLYGHRIFELSGYNSRRTFRRTSTALIAFWIAANLSLYAFYGHVHQAGVVGNLAYLRANVVRAKSAQKSSISNIFPLQQQQQLQQAQMNNNQNSTATTKLIFARQYLPPLHLLAIPDSSSSSSSQPPDTRFEIFDLSIQEFPAAFVRRLRSIIIAENALFDDDNNNNNNNTENEFDNKNQREEIYLSIPSALTDSLRESIRANFPRNVSLRLVHQHFPHFTAEDLEISLKVLSNGYQDGEEDQGNLGDRPNSSSFFARIRAAFSMNLWMIQISSR